MWGCARLGLLLALAGLVLVASSETGASPGLTERVSLSSAGEEGTSDSGAWGRPAVNASGRYVAFESFSTNLVSGDTQLCGSPPFTYNCADIFVRDRDVGTTTRVSVNSGGSQANGSSFQPAISSDGRYVAFDSDAANLVAGDTNDFCETEPDPELDNCSDVFVRDRQAGTTLRMSVSSAGGEGNGASFQPAISSDGRYVAFYSEASNLVSGDTNDFCQTDLDPELENCPDVFVRDRDTDGNGVFDEAGAVSTTRVSVDSGGNEGDGASSAVAISGDGRFVAFYSEASDLVLGDGNGYGDIFARDRQTGATTRVSVSSAGEEGDGGSYHPSISAEGRYVAFYSAATILVDGDTNAFCDMDGDTEYDDNCPDVFVRDRQAGTTVRVSVSSAGDEGNGSSFQPALSADGRYVAFHSEATNLVSADTNTSCDTDGDTVSDENCPDIFVRDRQASTTVRVSVDSAGGQAEGGSSTSPGVSPDGRYVAFYSRASNLVAGDTNGRQDVFLRYSSEAVGGMAELPEAARDSGRLEIDRTLLAGLAAAALALLAVGAWYAGRRFRQG